MLDKENVSAEVCEILASLFMLDPAEVNADTKRADIASWDSLQHVNVVLELEGRYQISFDANEVEALSGVSEIVSIVLKKAQ